METIGVRELQQHASKVIRRVEAGETLEITLRGRVVAVLSPPGPLTGLAKMIAEGRVQPATASFRGMKPPTLRSSRPTQELLDEQRDERR